MNSEISMAQICGSVTLRLRVTGQRRFKLRLRLGLAVMKLGVTIIGMPVEVEVSEP